MTRHPVPARLWAIWGLGLLLTIGVAVNLSPWLLGDQDWRWRYLPLVVPGRLARVGMLLAVYIALAAGQWAWALKRFTERRGWLVVVFAVLAGIVIQIAVQTISNPDPLSDLMLRTTSPFLAGYHEAALGVRDVAEFLRHFPDLAPNYLPHTQRHPPGLILYFVGLERFLERSPALASATAKLFHLYRCEYWPLLFVGDAQFASAAGGLLALPLNALTVIPLYAVGRYLVGEHAALAAVLISPLVPGYVLWAGIWDQAFVLVTPLLLWLLYLALVRRRPWAWWLAGGLLSLASFFTHAMLALVGFAAFYTLLHLWPERGDGWAHGWQALLNGLGFLVGLSSLWLVYWLVFGVTFFDVYRATTAAHFGMSTHYLSRLFYNPYDFVLFLGYVLGLLGLVAVWQAGHALAAGQRLSPAHRLILASALTLVVLTASGFSRAEVGRVWMFLMPLAVLSACAVEGGLAHSVGRWALTAALLGGQIMVMQSALELTERHVLHTYAMPPWAIQVGTRIGQAIELAGYEAGSFQLQPGDSLDLTLYWRTLQPPPGSYTVFVHVYDGTLGSAGQHDSPPRENRYPTTCWQRGEIVDDHIAVAIDPHAPSGTYQLVVGMYDPAADNQRLPTNGPGARDLSVVLTEVRVGSGGQP